MKRRVHSNPPGEALLAAFAPYVVGVIALWYFTKKTESTLPKKYEEVKVAVGEIKTGLPGAISDWFMGRNESTYITTARQQAQAKAYADLAKAKKAVAGFSPVVYGS